LLLTKLKIYEAWLRWAPVYAYAAFQNSNLSSSKDSLIIWL